MINCLIDVVVIRESYDQSGPYVAQVETTAITALIKKLSPIKHSLSVEILFASHQSSFNVEGLLSLSL